jgi:hypothetical protein
MELITFELTASLSLSIEFWCFLVVVFLCCLFAIVTHWVVHTIKNLNKRVERMAEEGRKKREEDNRNLRMSIKDDFINLRILMSQDYQRAVEEMNRLFEYIKTIDFETREHLKSLANEFMSREEEREHPEKQSQVEKQPKIDGKKSLRRGLEIQKEFTSEYILTHKDARCSLKKGEPDIVNPDKKGKVTEVVAVKSFELEITEKGKTCRNVKGHKYAVSITPSRDAIAEVETAKQNGLFKIRLVVFNLRTGHKIFDDLVLFDKKIKIREKKP